MPIYICVCVYACICIYIADRVRVAPASGSGRFYLSAVVPLFLLLCVAPLISSCANTCRVYVRVYVRKLYAWSGKKKKKGKKETRVEKQARYEKSN